MIAGKTRPHAIAVRPVRFIHHPATESRYMKTLDEVIRIQKQVEDDILQVPGVTGIDVVQSSGGQAAEEYVIRIYVEDKAGALERKQLPDSIQGVPVELVERRFGLA